MKNQTATEMLLRMQYGTPYSKRLLDTYRREVLEPLELWMTWRTHCYIVMHLGPALLTYTPRV